QYVKMISFTTLKRGTYYVDLKQANGLYRKVIVKDENGLTVKDDNFFFHNIIRFKDGDKKLLVKFNSNLNETITFRILDIDGNVVHEEAGINSGNYTSLLNLSRLHGTYNISV